MRAPFQAPSVRLPDVKWLKCREGERAPIPKLRRYPADLNFCLRAPRRRGSPHCCRRQRGYPCGTGAPSCTALGIRSTMTIRPAVRQVAGRPRNCAPANRFHAGCLIEREILVVQLHGIAAGGWGGMSSAPSLPHQMLDVAGGTDLHQVRRLVDDLRLRRLGDCEYILELTRYLSLSSAVA